MKQKFFDKPWWQNMLGATVGTIIGIIVTFGTTAYLEEKHKDEIARKTVIMTLHNIDASIRNAEDMIYELSLLETLADRALSLMPNRLSEMPEDSLEMVFSGFASQSIFIADRSTNDIFSHSFQIWESFDDVKVVGRIGNCFSEIEEVSNMFYALQGIRMKIVERYYEQRPPEDYASKADVVKALLERNDVKLYYELHKHHQHMMTALVKVVTALNNYNKKELGVSQSELDEIGKLLPENVDL